LARYLIGSRLRLSFGSRIRLRIGLGIRLGLGLSRCSVVRLVATTGFDLANSSFLIGRLPEHIDLIEELVGGLA
jgi:hypothetical protein